MSIFRKTIEANTLSPSRTLRDALKTLERSGSRIVLVNDDNGRLAGILTDSDIRHALLAGTSLEGKIGEHLNRSFVSVPPEAGRAGVLDLMQARWIEQIPVVDGDGRAVGLHLLHEVLGGEERANWAVIMCGGRGIRLGPFTRHVPKPMLRVAGRPILERLVLHLVGFGIRRIFLAVQHLAEKIMVHFGDGAALGCRIEYLREEHPLGSSGALALLPETPERTVVVLNGDLITQVDVSRMLDFHDQEGYAATVGVHSYSHQVPFGEVRVRDGLLASIEEKPIYEWQVNAGIYSLAPEVVARIEGGTELPATSLIEDCLKRRERVGVYAVEGDWIDVGSKEDLMRARGEE